MQQHLGRQACVAKVEVSLRDGTVQITPKEDGQIDPAQLLRATYDSGVTVAELDLTAQGKVVKYPSGQLVFEGNDMSKTLQSFAGTSTLVTIDGQLYKKPPGKSKKKADVSAPLKLLLLKVDKKE